MVLFEIGFIKITLIDLIDLGLVSIKVITKEKKFQLK